MAFQVSLGKRTITNSSTGLAHVLCARSLLCGGAQTAAGCTKQLSLGLRISGAGLQLGSRNSEA